MTIDFSTLRFLVRTKTGIWVVCILFGLAACDRPERLSSQSASPTPEPNASIAGAKREWGEARFDVCALLTKQEVNETVKNEVQETKSAGGVDGSLFISQCFYLASEMRLLVVISVAENNSAQKGGKSPNEFWKEMFDPGAKRQKEEEEEEASRRGRPAPEKVEGLGDEAYWFGGALYILKGQRFLRIAVSGSEAVPTKLSRARMLAEKALARL